MQGRMLAVLMWKHLIVRKRRYIQTPIEYLSPIVFFLILFCFKDRIKPEPSSAVRSGPNDIRNTDVLNITDLSSPRRVLFTPDTNLTNALMDEVGKQLGFDRLTRKPDRITHQKGYYPFSDFSEISDLLGDMYNNEAIVLFDNMLDRDTWPAQPRLNYTIRMKNAFSTDSYESQDGVQKPHSAFGDIYYQVMRLQWAIDTSYIKLLTGNEVPQRLRVQEFPGVARANNVVVTVFCEILKVISWMSLCLVCVYQMTRLVEERASGIQELVKMLGVSNNVFGTAHFLNILPAGLIYSIVGTILLKASSNPIIENSDGMLMFLALALHFLSFLALAYPCSYITQSVQYSTSIAVFVVLISWLPARYVMDKNVSGLKLISGMLPHMPVIWLWTEIAEKEQYGEGLLFSDITQSHSPKSGPVLLGFALMLVQTVIWFSLAWYLSKVRPGKYGQALPWNFLMQEQYWNKNEVKPEETESDEEEMAMSRETQYFEEPPQNMEVGIKIENVYKVFPRHTALNNVSLDVYKGEITVLLGHNGAGKTTLMSIITGMMSASSGKVYVNGADTSARGAHAVRQQMGLCPQHNLFYPDLSVLEHVIFFTLLKGGTYKDAKATSLELLGKLGLQDKAKVYSSALSGGMKRRLQLACALAGDATVLVLDEPTSGLDVETRRELWDLLLSLRGDRTVLLTTHFMEEADALGDRVAALHNGSLRCHATTMYLKKAIGTGYRLTFTTNGPPREAAVTATIASHVPQATLKEKTINSISYNLPATASKQFPALFTALEERRSELSIETIGVGVSTLEEVFLKLCSDTVVALGEEEVDSATPEPTYNKVSGAQLYCRQFYVLLKRQFKYVMYKKSSFFMLQMVIPIVMIVSFSMKNNNEVAARNTKRMSLDLDVYDSLPGRKVLYYVDSPGVSLRTLSNHYPKVDFVNVKNVADAVLRAGKKDATEYNKYIAGFEINNTDAKVLYTTTVRHAAPIALNLLSNALATRYLPRADGRTLSAAIDPVKPSGDVPFDDKLVEPKKAGLALSWVILTVFIMLATNVSCVALPCKERVAGARHIHVMSGCPGALHWAATLCCHMLLRALPLAVAAVVCAVVFDRDSTINRPDFIMAYVLSVFLGSLAMFAISYLVSFCFEDNAAEIVILALIMVFGIVTTSFKTINEYLAETKSVTFADVMLAAASYTMPPHAIMVAVGKSVSVARLNAYCELNKERCPNLVILDRGFDTAKCCAGGKPRCYMCIDNYSPSKEWITIAAQFIFYMTLVILTQRGTFNCMYDRILNTRYRRSARGQTDQRLDDIVRAEAVYVNKQIALPKKKIVESNHAMLVSDLHKNYFRVFGKSCNAVKGISFSVKQGECFGLLGVNGAGKSSTFKMLTGEECATKGQIYANGYFSSETQPYLRSLGYCPQFFGLDDFQSGRDNLTLLLTLRGLDAKDVEQEVKSWIDIVGLEKYSNQLVEGYSGGCTRRLAAAAALCVAAPITLLDEPTAGVDVAARRRVWSALNRGLRRRRAVVITSHSMDEMEALCSRIAIMAGGVVRAVGTPSELRARHAAGHAVIIKLTPRPSRDDDVDGGKTERELLKSSLESKFNCTLKDEHKTMLHYHINETMRYSRLFSVLEELRVAHPALEDYSVTETTLEEVFLAFAKEQREEAGALPARNHIV